MNRFFIFDFLIICAVLIDSCLAANILILSTVPTSSHSLWNQKLATLLADRKHQITIIDIGKSITNNPNITHYELTIQPFVDFDMDTFSKESSSAFQLDLMFSWANEECKRLLYQPEIKKILETFKRKQTRPIDLIIHDGGTCESFLGFVKVLGSPPLIQATAYSSATYLLEYAGLYDNPSYVPHAYSAFSQNMTFLERTQNLLIYINSFYSYYYRYIKEQNEMAKTFFEDDSIDVMEIAKHSKLALINTHPVLDGVKPHLPNIIPIGGFHIDKPKPLDKDLQAFLDDAPNGVVYFSLGSTFKCEFMKQDKIDIFINVFKSMKTKVIWKCGRNIPNLPSRIKLGKWFKQNDILAHPNVKVFITHGGLLGTQEGIYHGVPMLILPFIVDQHYVSLKLENMGIARRFIYADLSVESLRESLIKLLTDRSYKERMKERSELFRDNPMSPKDLAVFWIEYVLRHPDTNLLRSPTQNMPIYQLIMLDIVALFIGITVTIILFTLIVMKIMKNYFTASSSKTRLNKKKTN